MAAYLASKNQPKQLILETPYYSILEVTEYRFSTDQYLSNSNITIRQGTDDWIAPYTTMQKLLVLNLDNLNYVTIKKGSHYNLIEFNDYMQL